MTNMEQLREISLYQYYYGSNIALWHYSVLGCSRLSMMQKTCWKGAEYMLKRLDRNYNRHVHVLCAVIMTTN